MPSLPAPLPDEFSSPVALRHAFVAGLERQLAEPGLGTFILVLANASFDAEIWPSLQDRIASRFKTLAEGIGNALRGGSRLAHPEDDLMVFLKLMAMGLDAVRPSEYRAAGPWEVQVNPLRALRPARASSLSAAGVQPPAFDVTGFHFNKAFLHKEVLWQGELQRKPCRLLYNKFPFAPWHGLLVPEPERQHAQLLNQELHLFAWHLADRLGTTLPGFGLSYNSFGACASVNHLHFQTFMRPTTLPLEAPSWRHNGGADSYPAECRAYADPVEAWLDLERLHASGTAYNLIYRPGRLLCLPRRPQGSYALADWTGGHAWYEMAGGVVAFNRGDYADLNAPAIEAELRKTLLS
jgi:hypothetical protein